MNQLHSLHYKIQETFSSFFHHHHHLLSCCSHCISVFVAGGRRFTMPGPWHVVIIFSLILLLCVTADGDLKNDLLKCLAFVLSVTVLIPSVLCSLLKPSEYKRVLWRSFSVSETFFFAFCILQPTESPVVMKQKQRTRMFSPEEVFCLSALGHRRNTEMQHANFCFCGREGHKPSSFNVKMLKNLNYRRDCEPSAGWVWNKTLWSILFV